RFSCPGCELGLELEARPSGAPVPSLPAPDLPRQDALTASVEWNHCRWLNQQHWDLGLCTPVAAGGAASAVDFGVGVDVLLRSGPQQYAWSWQTDVHTIDFRYVSVEVVFFPPDLWFVYDNGQHTQTIHADVLRGRTYARLAC